MSMTVGFLFFILSLPAWSYAPKTHRQLVQEAVKDFKVCIDHLQLRAAPFSADESEEIESGNLWEDYNLWRKFTNWHFYHPSKDLGVGWLGIGHGSLGPRFQELQSADPKKLAVIGALSHYLQDVTNPAHVVPIYHGIGDSFDNFDFKAHWPKQISKAQCEILWQRSQQSIKKKHFIWELLQQTAAHTRARLEEKIAIKSGKHQGDFSWGQAFWDETYGKGSKRVGFGQYGFLGNEFGSPDLGLEPAVMAQFAREQIRAAQHVTVELFMRTR
jgi:hypothetical protein